MSLVRTIIKGVAAKVLPRVVHHQMCVPTPHGFGFVVSPDNPVSFKMASGFMSDRMSKCIAN